MGCRRHKPHEKIAARTSHVRAAVSLSTSTKEDGRNEVHVEYRETLPALQGQSSLAPAANADAATTTVVAGRPRSPFTRSPTTTVVASPSALHRDYTLKVADNPEAGVRFVARAIGPTTLVAIHPDSNDPPRGCWMDEGSTDRAAQWAERYNRSGWNLYFTANLPRARTSNKPDKDAMEAVRCFYADIDAKDGRTLRDCELTLRALPLAPSLIIASGGGYQPIWLLDRPRSIADAGVREWAEGVGRRIMKVAGGDAVWNVDRILRVPFTTNYPNEKKRRAGRIVCCSGLAFGATP